MQQTARIVRISASYIQVTEYVATNKSLQYSLSKLGLLHFGCANSQATHSQALLTMDKHVSWICLALYPF